MDSAELRKRTKNFALRIVKLAERLPRGRAGDIMGGQVLKAGTSVGANYREALRASSKRHFISILEIALREADETSYWLELLAESGIVKPALLGPLTEEANQLTAILAATIRTAKKTLTTRQARNPKSEI